MVGIENDSAPSAPHAIAMKHIKFFFTSIKRNLEIGRSAQLSANTLTVTGAKLMALGSAHVFRKTSPSVRTFRL